MFVLVANGESTLKLTERTFFFKVADRFSQPNIFTVYNRWDGSDYEDNADQVREQHRNFASQFLCDDLKVNNAIMNNE